MGRGLAKEKGSLPVRRWPPERAWAATVWWCVSGEGCEDVGGGRVDDRLLLGVGFGGQGKGGELGVDEVREMSPSEAVSSSESLSNDSVDW